MGAYLYCGDCLELLRLLPSGLVGAVITDPPYGTTYLSWDSGLDWKSVWVELERVTQPQAPIVLFSAQPFTTDLIMSRRAWFRYEMVWCKTAKTGFLNANHRPLQRHETISVFARGRHTYNPQMLAGESYTKFRSVVPRHYRSVDHNTTVNLGVRYPDTVLEFASVKGSHPSAKPLDLMQHLVLTYSNAGDVVLDFTMGGGSTGVACVQAGREFVGCELVQSYFMTARTRIREAEGLI